MSEAYAQQAGVIGIGILASILSDDPKAAQTSMGVAATVSAIALTLPHGREQEREGDRIGLELSARAGYDPAAAITLWEKMSRQGGQKPPEFLSTHPSDESRINDMRRLLPVVTPLYESARSK
jgi:predicted Zn-dependent protease